MEHSIWIISRTICTTFPNTTRSCRLHARKLAYSTTTAPASVPAKPRRWPGNLTTFGLGVATGSILYNVYNKQPVSATAALDSAWSTFTLESKEPVSPTSAIFTLKSRSLPSTAYDGHWERAIWAVDIQQPQLQIVREYTPLPPALPPARTPLAETDTAELHLLIRQEYHGEVSGYLHRLPIGAAVEVSRPHPQVLLDAREIDNLVLVVGGTGITVALQAVHALLETKREGEKKPCVRILWANRRREDCLGGVSDTQAGQSGWWSVLNPFGSSPKMSARVEETQLGKSPIVDELRRLKEVHADHLKVDYFVDDEGTFIDAQAISRAFGGDPNSKTVVAVSGPDGFMVNLAGEKRALKNRITGRPEKGILASLKESNWKLMILG